MDSSAAIGTAISQHSGIVTLAAGDDFSAAFQSNAWRTLATATVATIMYSILKPVSQTIAINVSVADADGDIIRCRWATASNGVDECGGVCPPSSLPAGTSIYPNCTILITGQIVDDWLAVALTVNPLSSVPVQFFVQVVSQASCTSSPTIIGKSPQQSCTLILFGQTFVSQLILINNCGSNVTIIDMTTLAFPGMVRESSTQLNTTTYYSDLSRTPASAQLGYQVIKFLLIRDDTTDRNGLSRFSVLDSSEKQYLYRLKSSNDDSNLLLIISYPSKDVLGYVGNEWRNEILNVTFEIYNSTTNQWTNGTIKKLPNLFTEKYLIEWNSQNFMMKKKLFSIHHKFYDECENVLAQFRMRFRCIRFALIVIFAVSALVIVGLSKVVAFSLFGVACASICSGFGEITMLQLTSFYPKHTVSAWSSGTGAAGLLGALSFAALTGPLKVKPRTAILILLFIPVLQVFSYIMVGASQAAAKHLEYQQISDATTTDADTDNDTEEKITVNKTTTVTKFMSKLQLVKPLLKYMIPLSLVYFAEYLINQGLYELIFFHESNLSHSSQYRWYSVTYQLGVFISRSSVAFFRINHLWILPIIQFTNLGIFFACVYRTAFIPSIWLVFGLVVFEGLIGGGAYVNTFYKISIEIPEPDREFSMGVASVGDSFGITFAGLLAIPLHNAICQ
ncbi:unnamed protein product [Rotaria magnacalcarata]|uniref:Battenin n=5 Tax=Rotaria TaxID=231623 RepID=A0A816THJ2_9BILA|nr:unnamed protein product [Rotaria magnacalcarata]